MSIVKICGVNGEAAFDTSVEVAADYIGFVFFQRSPRFVTARQAASLSSRHPGGPQRVGLFVLPSMADIEAVLNVTPLDVLQIYADSSHCAAVSQTFKLPVWRPVAVKTKADLPERVAGEAGFVIESSAPDNATRPGGNAVPMDWRLTDGWRAPAPWLLAGGLSADNVIEALAKSGAPGVDVSSGIEVLPGVKSPALIRRFVANARLGKNVSLRSAEHRV